MSAAMPLRSFIEVASGSHFSLENLPFGVFRPRGLSARVGTAIGDQILDLSVLEEAGHFGPNEGIFAADALNRFLELGRDTWRRTRATLQQLLAADNPTLRDD